MKPIILALSGLILTAAVASAGKSLVIDGESNTPNTLDLTGSLVRAYNLGTGTNVEGAGPADTSVHQTVTFQNIQITPNHVTSSPPSMVDLSDYAGDTTGVQIVTTTTGPHFGTATAGDSLYGTSIYANGSTANQALEISGLDKTKTYIVQVMVGGNSTATLADFDMNVFLDGFDSGQNLTWNNNSDDGITGIYNLAKVTVWGQDSLTIDLQRDSVWGPGISGVMVREQATNDFPFVLVPDLVPARGAETVDETANLQLTFDQTITKGSGDIRIVRASDDVVLETINVTAVSVAGAVVTIDPVSDLPLGEDLYVEIDATAFNDGAIDFPGFDSPGDWHFTVRPTTVSAVAANGTTGPNTPPTLRDTFGLVKLALNLGGADITYDGIDFTGSTATSLTNTVVFGSANGITVGGTTDGTAWNTATGIVSGSPGTGNIYADTFGTEAYPTGSDMNQTINISGLDAAETYQIQLMHGEDRSIGNGFDYIGTLVATGSDTATATLQFGDELDSDVNVFGVVTIEVTGTSTLNILYPDKTVSGSGRDPSIAGIVIKEQAKWVTTFTDGDRSASSTDLLQTNLLSTSGIDSPDATKVYDGTALIGGQGGGANSATDYADDSGYQVGTAKISNLPTSHTYLLNTTAAITTIDIFHGHKDGGRDGMGEFDVEVSSDSGTTWTMIVDYNGTLLQGGSNDGKTRVSAFDSGDLATGVNAIRITWHTWEAGFGPLSEIDVIGTADPVGPGLLTTTPADDSTNVAIDTNLVATFDASVQKGTGNIVIASAGGTHETIDVTSGQVSITGATVTINPSLDLNTETVYWVNIAGSAIERTSDGAAYLGLFGTTAWSFTTPITPPTVASWSADQSGPIFANKFVTYTVTFDKDMDGATVGTGDFGNAGSSDLSILSVTETSPTVFEVAVQPTSAGTLQLEITGAMESDDGGVLAPTADTTIITVSTAPLFQGELGVLDVVNANGGINPATGSPWADGDTYRLLFKTSTTTAATSSDIATYNTFVQNAASAAGLGTDWNAVGSTPTVDALDNTSSRYDAGADPDHPFFLIDGLTPLAYPNKDLYPWSGPSSPVNLDENGASNTVSPVWTGSTSGGTKDATRSLGNGTLNPTTGNGNGTDNWLVVGNATATDLKPMYAMSGLLTLAVPGPVGPAITGFSPDGVSGVALGTNLVITYDKDVQAGTGNITIGGGTSPIVIDVTDTGQVTISGDTVTINPTGDLEALTAYWVQVENGAIAELTTAIPATGINDTVTWNFTTVDAVAPTVASIVDNRAGGPIFENQTVTYTVTFSEDLDAGTIDASDFDNAGSPAATINQVSGSGDTYLVTVTPGGAGTLTLRVSGAGITDLSGNPLAVPILDGDTITVDAGDAPITEGVVTVSNQGEQPPVEQYGTILYAYNLGMGSSQNGGAGTSVHQGITFQDIKTSGNHTTSTGPATVDLSLYAGDAADTIDIVTTTNGDHFGSADLMGGDLFGSAIYSNSASYQDIQITGLDAGKAYMVQFGGGDNRNVVWNATFNYDVYVDGVDSGENIAWGDNTTTPDYGYGAVTFTGKTSIDIELVGSGPAFGFVVLSEVTLPAVANPYDTWSGGEPFDADKNGDGVDNGLAFMLGAINPDVNATGLLPVPTQSGSGLVLTFSSLNVANSGGAVLKVQQSSDLGLTDAWVDALVPETSGGPINGVTFVVTPGDPLNDVVATVSDSEASGGKLFARLKAEQP